MEFLLSSELWMALLALTTLEIVLGVDNLVFISIAVSRLEPGQRPRARRLGLGFARITRILLTLSLAHRARMDTALFVQLDTPITVRRQSVEQGTRVPVTLVLGSRPTIK